ncbi:MAG: hypothetical protein GY715_00565 [Planctomycetes bacterium]|nr:hypothetical protein [Planctomycetota bacterium]
MTMNLMSSKRRSAILIAVLATALPALVGCETSPHRIFLNQYEELARGEQITGVVVMDKAAPLGTSVELSVSPAGAVMLDRDSVKVPCGSVVSEPFTMRVSNSADGRIRLTARRGDGGARRAFYVDPSLEPIPYMAASGGDPTSPGAGILGWVPVNIEFQTSPMNPGDLTTMNLIDMGSENNSAERRVMLEFSPIAAIDQPPTDEYTTVSAGKQYSNDFEIKIKSTTTHSEVEVEAYTVGHENEIEFKILGITQP